MRISSWKSVVSSPSLSSPPKRGGILLSIGTKASLLRFPPSPLLFLPLPALYLAECGGGGAPFWLPLRPCFLALLTLRKFPAATSSSTDNTPLSSASCSVNLGLDHCLILFRQKLHDGYYFDEDNGSKKL